mgnify:CR=1 FL=1
MTDLRKRVEEDRGILKKRGTFRCTNSIKNRFEVGMQWIRSICEAPVCNP